MYRTKSKKIIKKDKKNEKKCWQRMSECDNIITLTREGLDEQWQLNSKVQEIDKKVNLLKVIEPSTKVYGANQTKPNVWRLSVVK